MFGTLSASKIDMVIECPWFNSGPPDYCIKFVCNKVATTRSLIITQFLKTFTQI